MSPPARRVDVVLNSLGIGGAERHSVALAAAMQAAGFAVRVIALSHIDPGRQQSGHPEVLQSAIQLPRRAGVDLRALQAYRRLVAQDPPDATITVNQYPLAFTFAAGLLPPQRRAPMLQIMHTLELPDEDSFLKRHLYPQLLRWPDAIAYVCELQRQHWRRQGITQRPDHCVHSGVDLVRFRPPHDEVISNLRAQLGLPRDAFIVGLCAVLRPEKRHDLLIDAIALLRDRGLHAHALLIGDGPERTAIETRVAALRLGDRVTITGYQSDVASFIAATDCMSLVSDYEAFSLSILESMAMARPVVATEAGAVREQITHGQDGLVVPRNDAHALADAIAWLQEDPARCRALGAQAFTTAHARFDAVTMHRRFIGIVNDLIDQAATPALATGISR